LKAALYAPLFYGSSAKLLCGYFFAFAMLSTSSALALLKAKSISLATFSRVSLSLF
jgi:hypothetical protein